MSVVAAADFCFSRGYGPHDNKPRLHRVSDFQQFRAAINQERAWAKGQQWFSGEFSVAADDAAHRSEPSRASAVGHPHRGACCVLPRSWVGLDIDGAKAGRPALTAEAANYLTQRLHRRLGFMYSTASHSSESARLRVVLGLNTSLSRPELICAAEVVRADIDEEMVEAGYTPLPWDEACDRPEQPLYAPLVDADFYEFDGEPLLAEELLGRAVVRPEPHKAGIVTDVQLHKPDGYAIAALDRAVRAVLNAPQGTRNDVINREAYGLGGFVGSGRIPRPLAEAALLTATRQAGWDDPAKTEATVRSALTVGSGEPRLDGLSLVTMPPLSDERQDKLKVVSLANLGSVKAPSPSFLFGTLIPRGVVTLLGSHGGSGKSQLALTWAAHAAVGRTWAGRNIERPMRVVFASLEDAEDVVMDRLQLIAEVYQLDCDAIKKNLIILDGAHLDAALVTEISEQGTKKLRATPRLRELAELVRGAELVVIDNASDAYDGDENNRRQVRYFMRLLSQLARTNNAGVLLLAHIDKQAAIHGAKGNSYSGSTAWHNSARSRLALVTGKAFALIHEKANLSALSPPIYLGWSKTASGARVVVPAQMCGEDATAVTGDVENDARLLLKLLATAADAGIVVPAAMSGPSTAAHALALLKELPVTYRSKEGRERIRMAVTELLRKRLLQETEIKAANRNTKLVLQLTQTGISEVTRLRASDPHTPSVTDARAEERASGSSLSSSQTTHASDATYEVRSGFTFSPYRPGVLFASMEEDSLSTPN